MISPDLPSQIQRMLDGELSAGELTVLERALLENEEARALYRKLATLHSDLEVLHVGESTLAKANILPFDLIKEKQRKTTFKVALYAAAAILMISMLLLPFRKTPQQSIASLRSTPAADFSLTHRLENDDTSVGQVLFEGSKLDLRKGTLEGTFNSGVRAVIEAPCVLRILASDRVAIDQGIAWFEVPENAIGFTVETKKLEVVDLGTAFGVDSAPSQGHDEVHVIRGAVVATSRIDGGKSVTLREGEARQVTGLGEFKSIEVNPHHFTTTLPADQGLSGHWEFETQSYGVTPDSSGNGHSGRLEGNAQIVTDAERGNVLSLSGLKSSGDGVDIDSVSEIPTLLAHRGVTLAAWIKRNSEASAGDRHGYIVALGASEDSPIMTLGITNRNKRVVGYVEGDGSKDQVQVMGDTSVSDGVWTHVAITYDRANHEALTYVNGTAQKSATDISRVGDGPLDWELGAIGRNPDHFEHDNRFFGGLIDEVRIYDRPLSPEEIAKLAQ